MAMTDEDWNRQHRQERPMCGSCKATGVEHAWNASGDLAPVEPRRPCRTCGGSTYYGRPFADVGESNPSDSN